MREGEAPIICSSRKWADHIAEMDIYANMTTLYVAEITFKSHSRSSEVARFDRDYLYPSLTLANLYNSFLPLQASRSIYPALLSGSSRYIPAFSIALPSVIQSTSIKNNRGVLRPVTPQSTKSLRCRWRLRTKRWCPVAQRSA